MLSVKHGGIKYHFFSFRYDSIWDWTPVTRTIGKHSTHKANVQLNFSPQYDSDGSTTQKHKLYIYYK